MKKIFLSVLFSILISLNVYAGINTANPIDTTDLLSCGTASDILVSNTPMTIMVWAKMATVGGGTNGIFVGKSANAGTPGFFFSAASTSSMRVVWTGGTTLQHIASDNSITLNTVQNFAMTGDGSNTAANYHLYVNNVETTYKTTINGATVGDNSAQTIWIGNRGDLGRAYAGILYEVVVWNRILTSAELTLAYHGGVQGFDMNLLTPKAWWKLNACGYNAICTQTFSDFSGNGHTCTPSGNPRGEPPLYSYQSGSTL